MAPLVIPIEDIMAWMGLFIWPFLRVGALIMVAPPFGANTLPANIRILVVLLVTLVIMPLVPEAPKVDPFSPEAVLIAAQQIIIGVSMGFILQLVFAVFVNAGEVIALTMGLGFASAVDPQHGVSVPVVSQFYTIVVTLLFLTLDGHLMLIEMLADSFRLMPVAVSPWLEGAPGREAWWAVAGWAATMFEGAMWVALPALTALLMVNLGLGVITRAAPQLNIFSVGFPLTMVVGFIMLLLSAPVLRPQFERMLEQGLIAMRQILGG
ncbi:MAG: flagellar biosynthetic protein FliR [Pseudomonadota bacterium]